MCFHTCRIKNTNCHFLSTHPIFSADTLNHLHLLIQTHIKTSPTDPQSGPCLYSGLKVPPVSENAVSAIQDVSTLFLMRALSSGIVFN